MAKDKRRREGSDTSGPEEVMDMADEDKIITSAAPVPEPVLPPPPQVVAPVKAASEPELQMTFHRWFAHTGRPDHHKAGMTAYLKDRGGIVGKRTVASWNALFANY